MHKKVNTLKEDWPLKFKPKNYNKNYSWTYVTKVLTFLDYKDKVHFRVVEHLPHLWEAYGNYLCILAWGRGSPFAL